MVMQKLDKILLRMIFQAKGQFIAVVTIIALGLSVFTALNMTSVNMQSTVDRYYVENRFADVFFQTAPVPAQAVAELETVEGVASAMGRITIEVPFVTEDQEERVNLRLVTVPEKLGVLSLSTLLVGNDLSGDQDEIQLLEQFANARGIEVGDEITLQIKGQRNHMKVVGIVANPEYIYLMENEQSIMPAEANFGVGYVSEAFGRQAAGLPGSYNEIVIDSVDGVDLEQLVEHLEDRLSQYGVKRSIERDDQLSNAILTQELDGLDKMSSSIPFLFLIVASIMLSMMLGRMVKKDRIKIGVLKAMGYSDREVRFHYVKYALAAGILGGLVGSALGLAMAGGMTRLYLDFFHIPLLQINFNLIYVLIAMILSAGFCTLAGLIGARGVLLISPADSMREEAPKIGKRILLERLPFLWRRLAFSNKLVMKNTFRKKKRALFIITGIMVTFAMMMFTTSMPATIDQMTTKHFTEFQKMDYTVNFYTPIGEHAIYDLNSVIDTTYLEGKLEYPFQLVNGNHKKDIPIIGLAQNTKFYTFEDPNGNLVPIPEEGILVSENLAKNLKVSLGDPVTIKSYLPGREDVTVTIKGIIVQALGMNAYMDMDNMAGLLLEKGIINGLYMNSTDPNLYKEMIGLSNVATIVSSNGLKEVYKDYMQMIIMTISFMVLFSGVLGFSIVYNATIITIGEREMEFSSLRVLGFSKGEIFRMLLKENSIVALFGILLGVPLGILFSKASSSAFSTEIYSLDMTPTFASTLMAALLTILFIVLAQIVTYQKINRLDFLQALKNRAG